jgi:hypothetical protein
VTHAGDSAMIARVPELGPFFGRLVAPPTGPGSHRHWIALDDLRYGLVTAIFSRGGEAREWSAAADPDLTVATLGRQVWLQAWEQAVTSVTRRAADAINARMDAAAIEASMPARFRRRLPLSADEVRALGARLDTGSVPFREALDRLEEAGSAARAAHLEGPAAQAWGAALATTGRRLEAAWIALEEQLAKEWPRWAVEVEEVRAWRRPLWPLVLMGVLLIAGLVYLGLLIGGFLPVPSILEPPIEWIWARWS